MCEHDEKMFAARWKGNIERGASVYPWCTVAPPLSFCFTVSLGGESLHEWEGISFIVDPGYLIHLTSCSQDSFITKPIKTSNRIKGRPADANIYRGDCDIQWGGYTVNIITQTKMFFYGKLYVYFYSIWGPQLYFLKKSLYPKTIKNIVISQKRHFQAFHPQPAVSLRRLHVCWIKYLITWPTD